ncbi:MAG: alpha-amylase, partial [Gammaproteobacteria bacterium]|nr:alpha-amylase [Gammaproteobacteria bacterium]
IAMLTAPGTPMVQNGQEFAEDHWMPEDDHGSGRRVQPRPLHWSYTGDNIGGPLLSLYRRLLHLRQNYEVLRADGFYPDYWEEWQSRFNPAGVGVDTERQLLVYRRYCSAADGSLQQAVIVLNFSAGSHWLELAFPEDGEWRELLSEPQWIAHVHNRRFGLQLPSHWGYIFYKA